MDAIKYSMQLQKLHHRTNHDKICLFSKQWYQY